MSEMEVPFDLAALREQFPIVDRCIYFNHAAVGPISRVVEKAMVEYTRLHAEMIDHQRKVARSKYHDGRCLVARLVNASPERIAYIQNTSHGLSLIAGGLAWQEGDNVVVPGEEFPSNYLVWKSLEAKGVALRTWPMVVGRLTADTLQGLVDDRTRLVAVSHVQFHNGFRCDPANFTEICRRHDALLVIDGTQSVGAMGIDVQGCGIDALVVGAHKWLLGPLGVGFMALSDKAFDRIAVSTVGWLSVNDPFEFRRELDFLPHGGRFEPGTENAAGLYGLLARVEQIHEFGIDNIERRILALNQQMAEGALGKGYQISTPRGPGEQSGILIIKHPDHPNASVLECLNDAKVLVSERSGGIRISPHYYNSEDEVAEVLQALPG